MRRGPSRRPGDLVTWCSMTRTLDSISAGSQCQIIDEAMEQTILLLEK